MKYAKIIYTVLLISLAVNFFVAGAMFVHFTRPEHQPRMGGPEQFNMEAARSSLSPQYRREVDAIWRDFRDAERDKFGSMFDLRRKVLEALTAEEFDQEAFEALSQEIGQSGEGMRVSLQNVLTEIALALPLAERRRYFMTGFKAGRMGQDDRPPRRPPGG